MIKIYCDICGKVINHELDGVEVNIAIPTNKPDNNTSYDFNTKHVCKDCKSKFMNVFRKEEIL